MWTDHAKLVKHLARKLSGGNTDLAADLLTVAQLALWEKIRTYDPSRGTTLWQHAYLRVRGAMVDELRKQDPVGRNSRSAGERGEARKPWALVDRVGLDIVMDTVPGNGDPEASLLTKEEERAARKYLRRLPENLQYVLRRTFLEGARLVEVAAELGVSESRVCQVKNEAVRKIREELMVYCNNCQKSYLDGPSKCPRCKGLLRHLRPGESPPWEQPGAAPPLGNAEPPARDVDPETTGEDSCAEEDDARGVTVEPEVEGASEAESSPVDDGGDEFPETDAATVDGEDDGDDDEVDRASQEEASATSSGLEASETSEGTRYLITYGGKTQGPVSWSKELGIPEKTIYSRIAKQLTAEQILAPLHPGRSDAGERIMIEHDGKRLSAYEWASITGISPATILWRHRAKWPADEILSSPAVRSSPSASSEGVAVTPPTPDERKRRRGHQPALIEHEGKRLTAAEWSTVKNLRPDTIITRLKRGWKVAEALDTPEIFKRAPSPSDVPPPEPPRWEKKVEVSVTPRTVSLLAAIASCNPGAVSDEDGTLERVLPVARELEKIDVQLKSLRERQIALVAELTALLGSQSKIAPLRS